MKLNPRNILFGDKTDDKGPVLLAVTPPRAGERTLLGVENLLQSIAVPEPFSLELAGDMDGVTLMARCLDDRVVRGQLSAHYPQARISKVDPGDDPLRLRDGEQAWSISLRADGPEYIPLRTFSDDDLLDPGSDPLIALMGALSALYEGERVVTRLMLRSLGPDWSQHHMDKAHKMPGYGAEGARLHLPDQAAADWTASRWPSSASAPSPPSRATCGCRTARYGRPPSSASARPWGWPWAAGRGGGGRRLATASRTPS